MDAFRYFCSPSNFYFRGHFTSTKWRHFFCRVTGTPETPVGSLYLWWTSGCDSVISGGCCGYHRVLNRTSTKCLPQSSETIHGTTIFFSTCKSSSNRDFHKSASIKCGERKTEMKPQKVRYNLLATVWYLAISCCEGHAKFLLFFYARYTCHQSRLPIGLGCKCETDPVPPRFAWFELDLLLANRHLQLIQAHSEAQQMSSELLPCSKIEMKHKTKCFFSAVLNLFSLLKCSLLIFWFIIFKADVV